MPMYEFGECGTLLLCQGLQGVSSESWIWKSSSLGCLFFWVGLLTAANACTAAAEDIQKELLFIKEFILDLALPLTPWDYEKNTAL